MSRRALNTRLARLAERIPDTGSDAFCAHHGATCAMGTSPLSDLYRMVIEAKQRAGESVPPLDEHRPATPKERRAYEREVADAIADQQAKNAAEEALLRASTDPRSPEA